MAQTSFRKASSCRFIMSGGAFCLPKRLEVVLEQAADPVQFRDGVQVEMRGKPASEKTPPHIFRQGQPGGFRLLRETRLFPFGDADRHPFPRALRPLSSVFPSFMPWPWNARSEAPSIRESRGRSPLQDEGLSVAQPPSCHEEPATSLGKSRIMCGERMSRFVRSIFGNHSEKLCMRQVGLILAMHFAWILRSVLLGKSPDEGNVR